ncbi:MAG: DUF4349 domain-containing protein [Anaerolineales bacterium]
MKKTVSSPLFYAFLALSILISACGAAATSMPNDGLEYPQAQPLGAPDVMFSDAEESMRAGSAAEAPAAQAPDRLVIKTANLSIVVDVPEQRLNEIGALAERLGGFVVSSSIYKTGYERGIEVPGAYITIRVPSATFQQALDEIRAGAIDVPTDTQSGQDVTAEYTDLQSRLRNLEGAEVMLRQIMEEATDTEDVLNAFNQLNYITEQIEVLKGQIKYYEESAAFSAISVELIANEAVQPIKVDPWDLSGVAKQAIEALVKSLQGLAEALVWFLLYVLPVILVVGLPILLIGLGLRAWRLKRLLPKKGSTKR